MTVYAVGSHIGSHVEIAIQRVTVITGKLHCARGPHWAKTSDFSLNFYLCHFLFRSDECNWCIYYVSMCWKVVIDYITTLRAVYQLKGGFTVLPGCGSAVSVLWCILFCHNTAHFCQLVLSAPVWESQSHTQRGLLCSWCSHNTVMWILLMTSKYSVV